MATSQNGWTASSSPSTLGLRTFPWITGKVRGGDVYEVFDYLCRRFDAEVEKINPAWSWGYAYRDIRGATDRLSNHASATAIDLNAPRHPLGKIGTFSPGQLARIRAILRDLDGAIRWGGDYSGRKDEMHFEVVVSPKRLAQIAATIRAGNGAHTPAPAPQEDPHMSAEDVANLHKAVRSDLLRLASFVMGGRTNAVFNQQSVEDLDDVPGLADVTSLNELERLLAQPRLELIAAAGAIGAGVGKVDPAEVAALVLAGLDPAAIAAAIPAEIASQVADELHGRLAG